MDPSNPPSWSGVMTAPTVPLEGPVLTVSILTTRRATLIRFELCQIGGSAGWKSKHAVIPKLVWAWARPRGWKLRHGIRSNAWSPLWGEGGDRGQTTAFSARVRVRGGEYSYTTWTNVNNGEILRSQCLETSEEKKGAFEERHSDFRPGLAWPGS